MVDLPSSMYCILFTECKEARRFLFSLFSPKIYLQYTYSTRNAYSLLLLTTQYTVRLRLRVFFRIFVLDSPICVVRCVPECGKRWRKVYCSISWRSFLSATCSDAFVSSSSARVVYSSNGSCNPGSCSDSDGMPTGSAFSGAWTPCDASRLVECPRCSPPC